MGPLRLVSYNFHRNKIRDFIITVQSWHVAPRIPSALRDNGYEVVAITDPTSIDQAVGSGLLVLMRRRIVLIGKVAMQDLTYFMFLRADYSISHARNVLQYVFSTSEYLVDLFSIHFAYSIRGQ